MNVTYFNFNYGLKLNVAQEYYTWIRSLLKIKKVVGKNFVRFGKHNDGGYIMVDNFANSGVAYSFGISNDVSWDSSMASRGYDVFMYDPTINTLPTYNEKFHFFREGIADREIPNSRLNTLEHFLNVNGHADNNNMILKMDVEGAEWGFLSQVSSETLSKFDQMVFEFHSLIQPKAQSEINATAAYLQKINRTHSLVHLHANNFGSFVILDDKILFPDTLELTYVNNANYELADDENIYLPISLDEPNNPTHPDIPLGFWNKQNNNILNLVL